MSEAAPSPEIRVLGGNPSADEIAAVTAVLSASLEELAGAERPITTGVDAWARSQRPVREPLTRGAWTRFGRC